MKKLSWLHFQPNDYMTIYASKLAGVSNLHPYQSVHELKNQYRAFIQGDNTFKTRQEQLEDNFKQLDKSKQNTLCSVIKKDFTNAVAVNDEILKIEKEYSPEIVELVRHKLYTRQGTIKESGIRNKVCKNSNMTIKTCQKFTTSKEPICNVNGMEIYVGGKHDGLTDDGNIVEIKNRMKGFLGIPIYDKVQIHAYMFIYETRHAILIENYLDETRQYEIEFDDIFWEQIKSNLMEFFDIDSV